MRDEPRRHGDTETRRHGDTETRRHGDTETRRHGDTETRRHGDTETRRHGGAVVRARLCASVSPWFNSMSLEVLHRALVFLSRRTRVERAEVAAFMRARVGFAGVETVLAAAELADHDELQ